MKKLFFDDFELLKQTFPYRKVYSVREFFSELERLHTLINYERAKEDVKLLKGILSDFRSPYGFKDGWIYMRGKFKHALNTHNRFFYLERRRLENNMSKMKSLEPNFNWLADWAESDKNIAKTLSID